MTFLIFGAVLLLPAIETIDGTGVVLCRAQPDRDPNAPRRHLACWVRVHGGRPLGFLGWFGPRGLASIVFAAIVVEEADLPHTSVIVSTTLVAVALSVLAHGVSAAPLVRRYVAW